MKYAVIENGDPVPLTATRVEKANGEWRFVRTLGGLSRAELLEFGVYEIAEPPVVTGQGLPVYVSGPVYTLDGDHVVEAWEYRAYTQQEADALSDGIADAMATKRQAKIDYMQFLLLHAESGLTKAQFANRITTLRQNPPFTFQEFTNFIRDQIKL